MIELRPAKFPDYYAIAKLHAESWQNNYRGIFSEAFLDEEVEKERLEVWRKRLRSPGRNQQVYLAIKNSKVAGFSCLYLDDHPTFGALLDNLHVSESFQKSGIGKLLLQNCARIILNQGSVKRMYLWVFESNNNAKKIYEHLGGTNIQSMKIQNEDGTKANACRYVWKDVNQLI